MSETRAMDLAKPLGNLAADIRDRFPKNLYAAFHAPRYAALLKCLRDFGASQNSQVLDVGLSPFAELAVEELGVQLDVLDLGADRPGKHRSHYRVNLNDVNGATVAPQQARLYDVIVLAEVIEHLHNSPNHVLAYLSSLMNLGGILIIQTPNAAALGKRIKLAIGKQPYELIRDDSTDPGHFREYTLSELLMYATKAGFLVEKVSRLSYFDLRYAHDVGHSKPAWLCQIQHWTNKVLPPSLRPGLMLVLRKASKGT